MATVPSTGRVTAPYGPRTVRPTPTSPLFHYGEDTIGDGNYAPEAGTIVACGYAGAYGNRVVIETPAGVQWSLCHNRNLNGRRVGQRVREGEFVAPMGATGNVTGIHVHTERRTNRGTVHTNPRPAYTSAAGGGTTPIPNIPSIPVPEEEDEDMAKNVGIYYTRARDKKMVTALVNPGSGFYSEWTSSQGGTYNNPIAAGFETGSFVEVTESHANALKADLALVRQGK